MKISKKKRLDLEEFFYRAIIMENLTAYLRMESESKKEFDFLEESQHKAEKAARFCFGDEDEEEES